MATQIDREGIFKARPRSWKVREADSGAVAVSIEFDILEAHDVGGEEWHDWTQYGEYVCYGDWWVIKKTGQVNDSACEQLHKCLGWGGGLVEVATSPPPDRVVQIQVQADTYKDQTRYKAAWMNPEDFVPGGGGAPVEKVEKLQARFGGLLRAAATSVDGPSDMQAPPPPQSMGSEPPPIEDDPF